MTQRRQPAVPFGGYYLTGTATEDAELTHVDPGTPCGEYMRRFWQPIELSRNLGETPHPVRLLGEDLVLFRDESGRLGLLHRHCIHRRAPLEYGTIERRGLRCTYHGWLYDIDGTVVERPAEPHCRGTGNYRQGAYPVREYKGIVFAYLGPPDETPEFPEYDTWTVPGGEMVPYEMHYPCNWLQVIENSIDPIHVVFLHTRANGPQFFESWGEMPVLDFEERSIGFFHSNTRRVDGNIWVRSHDLILPNMTQNGAIASMDGRSPRFFGRAGYTRWQVPIDNTHTKSLGWRHFNKRGDPPSPELKSKEAIERNEIGEVLDRPEAERRRRPSDYEMLTGLGPITIHESEHLATTDAGVVKFRRRLRKEIQSLMNGNRPHQPSDEPARPIPTYAGDTVLFLPAIEGESDSILRTETAQRVYKAYQTGDKLTGEARYKRIESELRKIADGSG